MMNHIYKSATDLASQIRERKITSAEAVKAHLDQIKSYNDSLNAIIIHVEKEALQTAEECDHEAMQGKFRGLLHGVPMSIKEQFWLQGQKSTINTKRYKNWIAPKDAVVVERLKNAGAVIMGKTNVPQFLFDYQVWGDLYPEAKNPYDLARTPGGSSGGSAIALASGMTPIELGGDMAGSVRIPAFFCGLYGLKPTEDTVPKHGNFPQLKNERRHVFEMATPGPMARTPDDLELVWKIIHGDYFGDRQIPRIDWPKPVKESLKEFNIAWIDQWPSYEPSQEIQNVVKQFVRLVDRVGCQTKQITVPEDLHERSLSLWIRLAGIILSQDVPLIFKPVMKLGMKKMFFRGVNRFADDFKKGFKSSFINYSETMGTRAKITGEWETLLDEYDLLVCPMSFGPAYIRCKTGSKISYDSQKVKYANYCWPYVACFNASGHPAMNIPLGLNEDGLPVGVQIVGSYWSEPLMIHFAKLISEYTPGFVRPNGY